MKIEKTYLECLTFLKVGDNYLNQNKKENPKEAQTKLYRSVESIMKQIGKVANGYNDSLEEINMKHCEIDAKTKIIILDSNGGYSYSKEGMAAKKKEIKALLDEKVELHIRILPENNELIDTLTTAEIEVFGGLVIDVFVDEFEKQFKDE